MKMKMRITPVVFEGLMVLCLVALFGLVMYKSSPGLVLASIAWALLFGGTAEWLRSRERNKLIIQCHYCGKAIDGGLKFGMIDVCTDLKCLKEALREKHST